MEGLRKSRELAGEREIEERGCEGRRGGKGYFYEEKLWNKQKYGEKQNQY